MKVQVVREYWENGEIRKRPGVEMDVPPEYFDAYEPFLRRINEKRRVDKTK